MPTPRSGTPRRGTGGLICIENVSPRRARSGAGLHSTFADHLGQWPLQPPLPLHSFLPAQALVSVLQPPLALHSFLDLQQALASAAAAVGSPSAAGAAA